LGCARIRGEPGGKRPLRYSLRRQKREKGFSLRRNLVHKVRRAGSSASPHLQHPVLTRIRLLLSLPPCFP
jgi:hypothetical protein